MIIYDSIKTKLTDNLSPTYLDIIDESHKHVGHSGYSDKGETHFSIKIISNKFLGMSRLQRQRIIYKILEDELQSHIHALSIKAITEECTTQ